jgi:hypothetical protein
MAQRRYDFRARFHDMKLRTLLFLIFLNSCLIEAQTVTSFDGIDASQIPRPQLDIDPNGAVGTKQYMEWINTYYQAYDKKTFSPVWSTPQNGTQPWRSNNVSDCYGVGGDGVIAFDRLASRWLIAARASSAGNYYYCVAISNTDDLTSGSLGWYTYEIPLNPILGTNSRGHVYFPDWPKLATWQDAYYVTMDLQDVDNKYQEIAIVACALDRTNMLTGFTPNPPQCFSDPSPVPANGTLYLAHSLIPADIEDTTAPPSGRDEFLVSIQNPPNDGVTTTSSSINLWDFHLDWTNPANSTFVKSSLPVSPYTPGCYNVAHVAWTFCVPEPSLSSTGNHYHVDSVGDRIMPRFAYRNFGSYESFLVSHTIQVGLKGAKQTGIRWYELRGSATPAVYQTGTIAPDKTLFRFMPSIAQDRAGNVAVGYSVSRATTHPGIRATWWSLPNGTVPTEISIQNGGGDEENSTHWGDYTSMTVDPVDDCTFWYVNEYFASNQTGSSINWNTRIANFRVSTCQ